MNLNATQNVMRAMWQKATAKIVWLCLFGAVGLRIFYFSNTYYGFRAHDVQYHNDYVMHVAKFFTIPRASEGYEFYQCPLYYFLTGAWLKLALNAGLIEKSAFENTAISSLIISSLTVLVAFLIARVIWTSREDAAWQASFLAIISSLPGLVFMCGKSLSNDYLFCLLSFLFYWQIAIFWQSGKPLNWWLAQIIVALAILTKGSGLTLLAIAYPCVLFKKGISKISKLLTILGSIVWLAISCGWYALWRIIVDGQRELIGNAANFDPHASSRLPDSFECLFRFSPIAVLQSPFNDLDAHHTLEYFWEFLFRSVFFGEWNLTNQYANLARATEFFGMVLISFAIWGITHDCLRRQFFLPALLTLLVEAISLWSYRFRLATIAIQDFRLIPAIAIPLTYYAISAVRESKGIIRLLGVTAIVGFVVSCLLTIFVIVKTLE
jgi:hypothetical protein